MNDDQFLQELERSIEWYKANGSKVSIERLLDCHDYLATMSFTLAEIVAQAKGSYLSAYFNRKYQYTVKKDDYKKSMSTTDAELKAKLEIGDIEQQEILQEQYMHLVDLKRQQLNRVIEAVKQRISYAKKEKERTEHLRNIENK